MDLLRFDHRTYVALLDSLRATHRLLRFCDLDQEARPSRFVILRHDVDYSPEAALALARIESEMGVRSSYFLLTNTFYYNLLAPEWIRVPRALTELGHEVGLHYDARSYEGLSPEASEALLRAQLRLLESLAGAPVNAIALHQPGLGFEDPFRSVSGLLNASDVRFCGDVAYYSDSCRAWRDETLAALQERRPPRFQLNLHPVNWRERDEGRRSIFADVHRNLAAFVLREGEVLWRLIDAHDAVREHERREGGGRGGSA